MLLWNVDFWGERKTGEPGKKPSELGREPTTNSTHIWRRVWEPGTQWEASALTTTPPQFPQLTTAGIVILKPLWIKALVYKYQQFGNLTKGVVYDNVLHSYLPGYTKCLDNRFLCAKETNLREFQFKLLYHRRLYQRLYLQNRRKTDRF